MTAPISHPAPPAPKQGPLKVLVMTHYYSAHGGGIELVAQRLMQELTSNGDFFFTWAASNCDPVSQTDKFKPLPMKSCNAFEKYFKIPWPLWAPQSLWALSKAIKKTDVLWLHDTLYFGNILAFYIARLHGKPIAITQHVGPIPYRNPLLRWSMRTADKIFSPHMLRHAQEVIFISDRIAEDYYRRITFTKAIKVVPNGVDIRLFHPPIPENRRFLREHFALKKDQPVLLFVGRFVEKKGLKTLRLLAQELPNYRFWLVGNGPINPDYWLLPNVHVFHDKKNESLAELYQTADLLLIPSYGEGFPLVIQEAMACGLPVLCGPSTAQGCRPAIPFIHIADLWPNDPERTAKVWLEKIKTFPVPLPLRKMQNKISEFAQISWDWPPIAQVYTDILKNIKTQK